MALLPQLLQSHTETTRLKMSLTLHTPSPKATLQCFLVSQIAKCGLLSSVPACARDPLLEPQKLQPRPATPPASDGAEKHAMPRSDLGHLHSQARPLAKNNDFCRRVFTHTH